MCSIHSFEIFIVLTAYWYICILFRFIIKQFFHSTMNTNVIFEYMSVLTQFYQNREKYKISSINQHNNV